MVYVSIKNEYLILLYCRFFLIFSYKQQQHIRFLRGGGFFLILQKYLRFCFHKYFLKIYYFNNSKNS